VIWGVEEGKESLRRAWALKGICSDQSVASISPFGWMGIWF